MSVMPNIRSQSVSAAGITVTGSDGRTVTVTAAQILTHYGSVANSKPLTLTWIQTQIQTALGAEMVTLLKVTSDFNTGTGAPIALTAMA